VERQWIPGEQHDREWKQGQPEGHMEK